MGNEHKSKSKQDALDSWGRETALFDRFYGCHFLIKDRKLLA